MAYGNNNRPTFSKAGTSSSNSTSTATARPKAAGVVLSTGLFAPDREGSKALATVRVKEAVTIPAGSYINLYENQKKTSDKSPLFNIQVRQATKKAE